MKPSDVKAHFKTTYRFQQETGMSAPTLSNWVKWGYVPLKAQNAIEEITKGRLKAKFREPIEEFIEKKIITCKKCGYVSNVKEQHFESSCINCRV